MKVEVSEEGIVFCDKLPCSNWMQVSTCCEECPMDKASLRLLEFQASRTLNEKY